MSLTPPLPSPPGLPPALSKTTPLSGKAPSSGTGPYQDEYAQLLETKWRLFPFPCISFHESNSFDLVEYKYPHLDNARSEQVGFNPRIWTLTIPFTNHIFPAKNESWLAGTLYPQHWNSVQDDWKNNKTSGLLQHPQLGQMIAKVKSWEYKMADKPRDGIFVTVQFVECLDDTLNITITNTTSSTGLFSLSQSATALDAVVSDPLNDPRLMPPGLSLLNVFTQITTYLKQLAAYPNKVATSINAQILAFSSTAETTFNTLQNAPATSYQTAVSLYQLNKNTQLGIIANYNASPAGRALPIGTRNKKSNITYNAQTLGKLLMAYQHCFNTSNLGGSSSSSNSSTGTLPTSQAQAVSKSIHFTQACINYFQSLNSNQTAQIVQGLYNFIANLKALKTSGNKNGWKTLSFVPTNAMTFMQVARYTNNTIDDIMSLNPVLAKSIFINGGATVYYFSSTGA